MAQKEKTLSQQVADTILSMITVEGSLHPGDNLPNENEFSASLHVSRATLREAVRILVSHNVLEIRRGRGTYVVERNLHEHPISEDELSGLRMNLRDLFEFRLMVEPKAAWYAAKRASNREIQQILRYGEKEEALIAAGEDRTEVEQAFHKSIAMAAHNEFVSRLIPIIYRAIHQGVRFSENKDKVVQDTLTDHRMLMEFIAQRNPVGAETAMRLHIVHAMSSFGIEIEE